MPVEREERRHVGAVHRGRVVTQHDHRAVVEPLCDPFERVHRGVEGCVDQRPGRHRHVDAEMHRAALVQHVATGIGIARVEQPGLVVATGGDLDAGLGHAVEDPSAEPLGVVVGLVAADYRVART